MDTSNQTAVAGFVAWAIVAGLITAWLTRRKMEKVPFMVAFLAGALLSFPLPCTCGPLLGWWFFTLLVQKREPNDLR